MSFRRYPGSDSKIGSMGSTAAAMSLLLSALKELPDSVTECSTACMFAHLGREAAQFAQHQLLNIVKLVLSWATATRGAGKVADLQ